MSDKDFVVKNGIIVNTSLIVATAGKVGVNTASPDATFSVVGTANVSGNVALASNLTVTATTNTGNLNVTQLAAVSALNITNQTNTGTIYASTSANVGANVQITTFGATIGNSIANVTMNSTSISVYSANSTVNGQVIITNDSNNQGRIEIGGSNGGYIDFKTPLADDYDTRLLSNSSGFYIIGGSSTSTNTINITSANLNVAGNTLFVDSVNSRVGIGNSAPADKLRVEGNISASGNGAFGNINATANLNATAVNVNTVIATNVNATNISGNLVGNVTASTITGNLTGILIGNVSATVVNASANVYTNTVIATNVNATNISGNLVGNVTATTITGNLTGNVAATTITGNLTGNVTSLTISTNNITTNSFNATGASANITGTLRVGGDLIVTGAITYTGTGTGDIIPSTNAYALGNSTSRWTVFGSSGNFSNGITVAGPNSSFNTSLLFVDTTNSRVGVSNTTPGSKLTVAGIIESTTGGVKFPDGTTMTSTTLFSAGGSNTQVQYNSSGSFGGDAAFTFNSANKNLTLSNNISANTVLANPGTAGSPSYSFAANSDTGMYNPANGQLSLVSGGIIRQTMSSTGTVFAGNITAANAYVNNITSNSLSVTGDATISGNLTILGTTLTVNTQNLIVNDNIIELGLNNTNTDVVDTGFFSPAGNSTVTWYSGVARIAASSSNSNPVYRIFGTKNNPNTSSTIDTTSANTTTGSLQAFLQPYGSLGAFVVNSTSISISANSTVPGSIAANSITISNSTVTILNSTSYSGTSNNTTYLNGQLASYYSNATNITTGTLPNGQLTGSYTGITGTGALASGSLATGFTAVGFAQGGTSATTRQAALNALAGGATAAYYLRGDGTNIALTSLQAADVNTAINSSNISVAGVNSASYTVGTVLTISNTSISYAGNTTTLPTVTISNTGSLSIGNSTTTQTTSIINIANSAGNVQITPGGNSTVASILATGSVNAYSYTVGTSTVANSTGVYTGVVNATTINSASYTVGTSTVVNSAGVYTGVVNATSVNSATITAGSTTAAVIAISGLSNSSVGVYGQSNSSYGVQGIGGVNGGGGGGIYGISNTGYGLYAQSNTGIVALFANATATFAGIYANGNIGIGNSAPASKLTVAGQLEFTASGIKFSDGSTMTTNPGIGTGTGAGSDTNFFISGKTVNTNYTAQTAYNYMSAGPITLNADVTIQTGSRWVIV